MKGMGLRDGLPLVIALAVLISVPLGGLFVVQVPSSSYASDVALPRLEGLNDEGSLFDEFSISFSVGEDPSHAAIGDVNGDSRPDVLVTRYGSSAVSVFLQDADGSFGPLPDTTVTIGGVPSDLALADMDNNGRLDVVLVYPYLTYGRLVVLNSSNSFAAIERDTSQRPVALECIRMDSDGRTDVAVLSVDPSDDSSYLEVHRAPNFNIAGIVSLGMVDANVMCSGDLDGDMDTDLVVGSESTDSVTILRNSATSGLVWNETVISPGPDGPVDLFISRIVASGNLTLGIVSGGGSRVELWQWPTNVPGTQTPSLLSSLTGLVGLIGAAALDLNDDPRMDLVIASASSSLLRYYDTPTSFPYPSQPTGSVPIDGQAVSLMASEVNGDASADLLVLSNRSDGEGVVTIFNGLSGDLSNANDNLYLEDGWDAVAAGDFGTGEVFAFLDAAAGRIRIVDPSGEVIGQRDVPSTASVMSSGKLLVSAFDDLVVLDPVNERAYFYWGLTNFTSSAGPDAQLDLDLSGPSSAAVADVDSDGLPDLVVGGSDGWQVFFNSDSDPHFSDTNSFTLPLTGQGADWIMVGNLNVGAETVNTWETLSDVALVNTTNDTIEIYYQRSTAPNFSWSGTSHYTLDPGHDILWAACGDLTHDGLDDIVVGLGNGQVVTYYQNRNLNEGFDESYNLTFTAPSGFSAARLGDLDDDAMPEVLLTGGTSNSWAMVQFDDDEPVVVAQGIAGSGTTIPLVGDIDEDGRDDVVMCGPSSLVLSLWYQRNLAPHAQWTGVDSVAEGTNVTLDASSSWDSYSDNSSLTYTWTFPGSILPQRQGKVLTLAFPYNSTFTVQLRVEDDEGLSSVQSRTVVVTDVEPIPDFSFTPSGPQEGSIIAFHYLSLTPADPIVYYHWDFGDGYYSDLREPSHTYGWDGQFTVSLTVRDNDSEETHTVQKVISVMDAGPVAVIDFHPAILTENDTVTFDASNSTFLADQIVSYEWWFEDDDSVQSGPLVQHSFLRDGRFVVRLTVTDNDTEGTSTNWTEVDVLVLLRPPVPMFTNSSDAEDPLLFHFSASLTTDPDDDIAALLFRWDFGDGSAKTTWSSDPTTSHRYSEEGGYTVRLEVRDPINPVVYQDQLLKVDLSGPMITVATPLTKVYYDEPIQIFVLVEDEYGQVGAVYLNYTLNGVNHSVLMTAVDAFGNYSGQIPSQNRSMEIPYHIAARDDKGNWQESGDFQLTVKEEPTQGWMYFALGALAAFIVGLFTYLWASRPVVDEVFLIYQDGNLLAHETRRLKPNMDDQIMGSMLVAIQGFVRDSFQDEGSTALRRMDFGDTKLMIEKGDNVYVAVVLNGTRTGTVPGRLQKVLDSIGEKYGTELEQWDGDMERVRGIKDETKPLFERVGFKELRIKKNIDDK